MFFFPGVFFFVLYLDGMAEESGGSGEHTWSFLYCMHDRDFVDSPPLHPMDTEFVMLEVNLAISGLSG